MANKNTVTMTLAGDSQSLEKAAENSGAALTHMADEATAAGRKAEAAGGGIDRVAESSDRVATKAGTAYGATGALGSGLVLLGQDSSGAGKALMDCGLALDAMSGVADVATLAMESQTVKMIGAKVATLATSAATNAWAAAQRLLNVAMNANPVGLIIIAIVALIAIIVLIATKTTWFQDGWRAAWKGIQIAASAVWDWLKALPGKIGDAFKSITGFITAPFRAAFNYIADAWNNTAGSLSFHIPDWVPKIGGAGFSMPKLPHFHTGGIVPGLPSQEVLAVLRGQERITPTGAPEPGGAGVTNHYHVEVTMKADDIDSVGDLLDWFENLHNIVRQGPPEGAPA